MLDIALPLNAAPVKTDGAKSCVDVSIFREDLLCRRSGLVCDFICIYI